MALFKYGFIYLFKQLSCLSVPALPDPQGPLNKVYTYIVPPTSIAEADREVNTTIANTKGL